jgi:hypothetical protein
MRIPSCLRRLAPAVLGVFVLSVLVSAQSMPGPRAEPAGEPRLRVYFDCASGGCDRNFLVNAMPFILFTQDRLDADIHALVTRIGTAAGGSEYTIALIGRGPFANRADTLRATVLPNSTDDMRRRELARVLQVGLFPYAVRVTGAAPFSVRYDPPNGGRPGDNAVIRDPWDFWVYRARVNTSGSAESLNSTYQLNGNVSATRVTEELKLTASMNEDYRANTFTLSDGSKRTYILRSRDISARVVRSVSDHWSVGTRVTGGRTDFRNQDAHAGLDVSAEYNYFPWRDATSRQLIAAVALGGRYYDYAAETVFGEMDEVRPVARAILAGESRQQWGTLDATLRYTHFLHDAARYNVSFNGRAQLRLTRGLALEVRGDAAKVNDQLYLPRGGASDEEVLTRQRALATAFRVGGAVGLSFTFGSIFNSIVNPRLDELGT